MSNIHSGFVLPAGNGIKTGLVAGNTFLLEGYNTNTLAYVTLATITAGNPPTMALGAHSVSGTLAMGANSITMTGSLGATGARVLKGWFTDLEVTNDIAGDITGNAVTVTGLTFASGKTLTVNNILILAGTDSTIMTFPATSTTIAGLSILNTFTVTQAITPTDTNGLNITTSGTTYAIASFLDINGNQRGLFIDSESASITREALYVTGYGVAYFICDLSSGYGLKVDRNLNETGVYYLASFLEDHTANTSGVVSIQNDGSGNGLFLDQNGNGIALNIDSEATSAIIIQITNAGSGADISAPNFTLTNGALVATGLALGTGSITMSGSIGVTGTRITKGWFTDLEVTNAIAGSVTGNAGSATYASATTITDDTTTVATMYPLWVTTNTGNLPTKVSSTKLSFVPSTGILTATGFSGALTGNVTGNVSGSSGSCTGNAATVTRLTFVSGKTLTVNNILTLAGTDSTIMTFPATSQTIAGLGVNQTFTAGQIITVANTVNQVGLTINQNDTTNNKIGFSIANTGTGNCISATQTGNGIGFVFTNAGTSYGFRVLQNAVSTGGPAFQIYTAQAITAQPLVHFWANNAGFTASVVSISATGILATSKAGMDIYSDSAQVNDSSLLRVNMDNVSSTAPAILAIHTGTGNAISIDENGNGLGILIDKDCTVNNTRTWAMQIASDNAGTGTALGCGIDMSSFSVDEPILKAVADAITVLGVIAGQIAIDIAGTTYYIPYMAHGS